MRMCRINYRQVLAVFLGISLLGSGGMIAAGDLQTLLISVIQTSSLAEARALLVNEPHTGAEIAASQRPSSRVWGTRSRRQPGSFQQVRVLEGHSAFVSVSRREPEVQFLWVEERRNGFIPNLGLSSRESSTGFFVKAELKDDEVVLQLTRSDELSQYEYTSSNQGQVIRTTITGRPGEWLDTGGSMELPEHAPGLRIYSADHPDESQFRVLVKVELVP